VVQNFTLLVKNIRYSLF